jgi:hypothetical protein
MRALSTLLFVGLLLAACNGTTGGALVSFSAYAEGAPQASAPFTAGDYEIHLTSAQMRVGAVYFDESPPSTGFDGPVCITPDIYAAQVSGGVEVDLLKDQPQEFSVYGDGSNSVAASWDLWLTDGDINEANIAHIVDLQGSATRISDGAVFSFGAVVTINANRQIPASDPSQPGLNPICKQRIVQIGGIDLKFYQGGSLYVTIDPRVWFRRNLDFSSLPLATSASCQLDPNTNFSNGAPCKTSSDCSDGYVCDPELLTCAVNYCIPDSNFATGLGASQGQQFFSSILAAGPDAYGATYASSPPSNP